MHDVCLVGISTRDPVARALRRAGYALRVASDEAAARPARRVSTPVVVAMVDDAPGDPAACESLFAAVPAACGARSLVLLRRAGERRFEVRVIGGAAPRAPLDADGVAALVDTLLASPAPAEPRPAAPLVAAVPRAVREPSEAGAGRTGSRHDEEALVAGEVELDPVARTVKRGGEPIRLNPREFDLLAYLVRRPGEVVYREELLAAVWGDGPADPERSQTHAVHMRWLRQKLERDPSHPAHLRTIRRVGYTFLP